MLQRVSKLDVWVHISTIGLVKGTFGSNNFARKNEISEKIFEQEGSLTFPNMIEKLIRLI